MSPVRSIATTLVVGPAIAFGILAGSASAAQAADHDAMNGGGDTSLSVGAALMLKAEVDLGLDLGLGLGGGGGNGGGCDSQT